MFIEAVNDDLDYGLNGLEKNGNGLDGQHTYILIESGKSCNSCFNHVEIFDEIKRTATALQAVGLESLGHQAAILAPGTRPLPPNKDSAYLRCMDACDAIELEPFKLLCYLLCLKADDTPGS